MSEPIDRFVDAMWDRFGEYARTIALTQAREAHSDLEVAARWHDIGQRLAEKFQRNHS